MLPRVGDREDARGEWIARVAPFVVHGALLLVLGTTGLDEAISDRFFDAERGEWPLQHGYWSKWVLHHYARDLIFVVAVGAMLLGVAGQVAPRLRRWRDPGLCVALSIGLTVGLVALVKEFSATPCPWNSLRYGGALEHRPFPLPYPDGVAMGRCFPGAHAAGAYALMSLHYALRPLGRRWAWWGYGVGWSLGTVYGVAQIVRGAHYTSHNLWSGLLAWSVCMAVGEGLFGRRLEEPT